MVREKKGSRAFSRNGGWGAADVGPVDPYFTTEDRVCPDGVIVLGERGIRASSSSPLSETRNARASSSSPLSDHAGYWVEV